MKKLLKITLTLSITLIIVLGFAMPLNPPNGTWQQQFFPDLNGRTIADITFADSLNGIAVTRYASNDTNYILKSTNSGDNWSIVYRQYVYTVESFSRVQFLSKDTGYAGGNNLLKTTNSGLNWTSLNIPPGTNARDFFALNEDTIWFADNIAIDGGIYRTTNKGVNWVRQFTGGGVNPTRIYMYNRNIGFMVFQSNLYKTTNSGANWSPVPGGGFIDIYFIDSLTGWKANGDMKKTTDGGLSWVTQTLPSGGIITGSSVQSISVLNKDTVWGSGGGVNFGGNRFRGTLYRTINGGNNWLFQIPDTSIAIAGYYKVQFLNKNLGWAFGIRTNSSLYSNIHTTNGGDTTFIVGLQQISTQVPKEFMLYQNYPNPFNPKTNIKYSIMSNVKGQMSNVKLTVFDVSGKEIAILVNQEQNAGTYVVDWNAANYSSGVYFYRLEVYSGKEVFTETRKMLMIK